MGLAYLQKLNFNLAVSRSSPIKCGLDFRFYCLPTAPLHEAKRLHLCPPKERGFHTVQQQIDFKTCIFSSDSLNQIFSSLTLILCTGRPVGSTKSSSTLSSPVDALDLLGLVPVFTHVAMDGQSLHGGDRVNWSEGSQVCGTWCVWTLLPILFAGHWIAMLILPHQGFLRIPSLPAVSWAITMCRIQCWDLIRCHSCWDGQFKLLIAVKSTLNMGVRQCKTNMIIAVTGKRQGVTDAEFLWKGINKMKSVLLGFFHEKDSKKDVNVITWKQELNKKRNRGQARQEQKNF